jgi:hypothetical protein
VRDFQKHFGDRGKNFPATGPLGPGWSRGRDQPIRRRLELTTRLNGSVVQHDTTDHMIFDVATIIEYLSTVTWLEPGDVIATGTPDGVGLGRKPPLWMKGGDKLEVEISESEPCRSMSSTSEPLQMPADVGWKRDAKVISLVATAHFVSHVYIMLLPPIFLLVKDHFAVGYTDIALALTAYNVMSALLQTPAGFLVDRIGARVMLTAGLLLSGARSASPCLCPATGRS